MHLIGAFYNSSYLFFFFHSSHFSWENSHLFENDIFSPSDTEDTIWVHTCFTATCLESTFKYIEAVVVPVPPKQSLLTFDWFNIQVICLFVMYIHISAHGIFKPTRDWIVMSDGLGLAHRVNWLARAVELHLFVVPFYTTSENWIDLLIIYFESTNLYINSQLHVSNTILHKKKSIDRL